MKIANENNRHDAEHSDRDYPNAQRRRHLSGDRAQERQERKSTQTGDAAIGVLPFESHQQSEQERQAELFKNEL